MRRTENEKNRRRDLITALRSRRQQMLLSLKRENHPIQRSALGSNPAKGGLSASSFLYGPCPGQQPLQPRLL